MIKGGINLKLGLELLKTLGDIRELFEWNTAKTSKFHRLYRALYYLYTLPLKLETLRAKA